IVEEGIDLLFSWTVLFGRGDDCLESLRDDALNLQKLLFVVPRELLFASEIYVVIKLFPAFDVVLEVHDEFIEALVVHGGWSQIVSKVKCGWVEENECAAAKFAGDDGESTVADVEVTKR